MPFESGDSSKLYREYDFNMTHLIAHARVWYRRLMSTLALSAIALTTPLVAAAASQTWYLMAPDEKILSNPEVAIRMARGPVMGPLDFTTRGKFSSRDECEPARRKLISQWWQLSVIKRGSWNKYGFVSPSVFVLCVRGDDPQLKYSPAGAESLPSMETFVNRPHPRF
jgi:hypothetical protein